MKIAVVFDTLHPDWEDADYRKEMEAKVEEAEFMTWPGRCSRTATTSRSGRAGAARAAARSPGRLRAQGVFNGV